MNKSFACLALLAALLLIAACHSVRENSTLVQPEAQMTAPDQALKLIEDTAPPPVELFNYPDGDSVVLWWRDWNPGDYNVDGTVNGLDLFPLAANFQEVVTRENGLSCVDGNEDDVLNGLDVFTIAVNFQNELDGYNVYSAPTEEGPFETRLNTEPLPYVGCGERQEFVILGGSKAPEEYYTVRSNCTASGESLDSLPVGRSSIDLVGNLPEASTNVPQYEFGVNPVTLRGDFIMEWYPGEVNHAQVDYDTGETTVETLHELDGGTLLGLSLDFRSDGTIGVLLSVDDELILKQREPEGDWTEGTVFQAATGFVGQNSLGFKGDYPRLAFGYGDGDEDALQIGDFDGNNWSFQKVPGSEGSVQNPQPRVYVPPLGFDLYNSGVLYFNWQYDDPEEPQPVRRLTFAEKLQDGWELHKVLDFDGPGFPTTPSIGGSAPLGKLAVNFTDIFADQMFTYTRKTYDVDPWKVYECDFGSGTASDMTICPVTGRVISVRSQWEDGNLSIRGQSHRTQLFSVYPRSEYAGVPQVDIDPNGTAIFVAYADKDDDELETPYDILTFRMTPQF